MKKTISILISMLICRGVNGYAQGNITRKNEITEKITTSNPDKKIKTKPKRKDNKGTDPSKQRESVPNKTVPRTAEELVAEGDSLYGSKEYTKAFQSYKQASEMGSPYAQFCLGSMYYNGKGVTQDYQDAVKFYSMAAEQGNALDLRDRSN